MAIYPVEFYRRAEEKWRRRSKSLRDAVTGSPSKKEGDDTLVRWPWLLAIGQELQSEYAVLKKQPYETSCGTPEEAYIVPPSLTVAIRDQQLCLVRPTRPRQSWRKSLRLDRNATCASSNRLANGASYQRSLGRCLRASVGTIACAPPSPRPSQPVCPVELATAFAEPSKALSARRRRTSCRAGRGD